MIEMGVWKCGMMPQIVALIPFQMDSSGSPNLAQKPILTLNHDSAICAARCSERSLAVASNIWLNGVVHFVFYFLSVQSLLHFSAYILVPDDNILR